jgi:hypothetical protein
MDSSFISRGAAKPVGAWSDGGKPGAKLKLIPNQRNPVSISELGLGLLVVE